MSLANSGYLLKVEKDSHMEKNTTELVLIIPCYNEEQMLAETASGNCLFIDEVDKVLSSKKITYNLLFVNDGSSDGTLSHLRRLTNTHTYIHYISFSRNFGKESALYAGLEKSLELFKSANYFVTMDVDLQDPPMLLPQMLDVIKSGEYDSVATRRVTRKGEPKIRSFFARLFYKIINKISDTEIVDGARDYRMMTRRMVESLVSVREVNRFSKGLFSWVGFNTKWLEYENIKRAAGETKWSFWKLFKYSIDGIVSFSTMPLSIASIIGCITCIAAFIYLSVVFIKTLVFGEVVAGYPSLMCVILFLGGVQLICVGILGQYLAKTYLETKKRPIYIIKEEK